MLFSFYAETENDIVKGLFLEFSKLFKLFEIITYSHNEIIETINIPKIVYNIIERYNDIDHFIESCKKTNFYQELHTNSFFEKIHASVWDILNKNQINIHDSMVVEMIGERGMKFSVAFPEETVLKLCKIENLTSTGATIQTKSRINNKELLEI